MDPNSKPPIPHRLEEMRELLSLVLDHIGPSTRGINYRLVGTAAALVQGVQLPVGDVDVLVARRDDVDAIATALTAFPCKAPPAWLSDSKQYFARFEIMGTEVEISTVEAPCDVDTVECMGTGPWEHCHQVVIGQHQVPVVALELRLITELDRNRPERYLPLIEHMRVHGADLQLMQRAMASRTIGPEMQQRVLAQLHPQ